MFLIITESLCIILLILFSFIIWQRSFTRNVHLLMLRLFRLIVTYAMGYSYWLLLSWCGLSVGVIILASTVLSTATYLLLGRILRVAKSVEVQQTRLGHNFQRLGNLLLISLIWITAILFLDLAATFLERSVLAEQVQNQSWLLRHFMQIHRSTPEEPSLEQIMDQQNRFLAGFASSVRETRKWVYDKTGLSSMVKQVNALQEILSLSHAQRAQRVADSPALQQLMHHPKITRLVENPKIVKLIEQAGQGQARALWALQQHPDINALFKDQDLYKQLMSLDPQKIVARGRKTEAEQQQLLPVIWYTTTLLNTSELTESLENPQRWQHQNNTTLTWPDDTRFGAATAQIQSQPGQQILIHIQTQAKLTVLADRKTQPTHQVDQGIQLTLTATRQPIELCLLLDYRLADKPRTSQIRVTAK